jgi:hypothetical protein
MKQAKPRNAHEVTHYIAKYKTSRMHEELHFFLHIIP